MSGARSAGITNRSTIEGRGVRVHGLTKGREETASRRKTSGAGCLARGERVYHRLALRSPDVHWLAWFSFVPLFVAVRSLRPMMAALAGGLWGACPCLFTPAGPAYTVDTVFSDVGPPAWLLWLLIVIPVGHVDLAARADVRYQPRNSWWAMPTRPLL